ncbi:MAG TPA: AzlC family ABC transporter permease [Rhodothermales bacterium]|nr:AzlC family ABC transporter permease [Rhodothermales bacterium]
MASTHSFHSIDALTGARLAIPLAVSVFVYGSVFGMLASGKGMTLVHATGMSATLFAGAAQFVVVELWTDPLPVLLLTVTTLIVNVRFLLYGATIAPWFSDLTSLQRYGSAFFLVDETFALAAGEMQRDGDRRALLLGSGLLLWMGWVGGTFAGHFARQLVEDPAAWGLDFVYIAVFIALLVGLRKGPRDVVPWGVAAVVALVTERVLPGAWYVVLGGVAGSVAGALRGGD